MLLKTKGIVFRFTRYAESSIIVNVFTEKFGLQSYIVNGVRSKNSRGKMALYQPLTLLDMVVYHRENANIMRIREVKVLHLYQTIPGNVHKTAIALFIAEILNKTVKEQSHAEELCEFIIDSLITLDGLVQPENFHLVFLVLLSRHLGIQPQTTDEVLGRNMIERAEEEALALLLRANYTTLLDITQSQRRVLLDRMIQFYSTHIDGFGQVKSIPVLREILNT